MIEDYKKKEVLRMAGPVLVELIMATLFGMVDMIMLGNYGGRELSLPSIGAVGITNQFIFIGLYLAQSLNIGGTTMVARYIGQGRERKIEAVLRHVILLTQVLLVLPLLIIGFKYTIPVMTILGARPDMIEVGSSYFRIILLGFIFQAFNFSVFASLRGAGDTKSPMRVNLVVNLLNVLGNGVLIYGLMGFPEMGINGAATSTTISHLIASIALIFQLLKSKGWVKIDFRKRFRFDRDIIYNLVKIGVPSSLEQISLRIGIILFTRLINSLGTLSYAAHQIAIQILNLSFTPGQAFGIAASTLTGRSLGENRPDLAEDYIFISKRMGAFMAVLMGVFFFFFGHEIAGFFNKDPEVIDRASDVLKLMAFIQPFQASQLITSGGLRGAGDTVWTLVSTFFGILIIRNSLARLFINQFELGLLGAWMGILIDQFLRWIFIGLRYRSGNWKYIDIK